MTTISDETCLKLYKWAHEDDWTPTFLYEHYMDEMPYGVSKARDGDPDNWLADRFEAICEDFAEEIERGRKIYEAQKEKK